MPGPRAPRTLPKDGFSQRPLTPIGNCRCSTLQKLASYSARQAHQLFEVDNQEGACDACLDRFDEEFCSAGWRCFSCRWGVCESCFYLGAEGTTNRIDAPSTADKHTQAVVFLGALGAIGAADTLEALNAGETLNTNEALGSTESPCTGEALDTAEAPDAAEALGTMEALNSEEA